MQGLESSLYELQVSHPGQQSARAWGPQSYNHKEMPSSQKLGKLQGICSPKSFHRRNQIDQYFHFSLMRP